MSLLSDLGTKIGTKLKELHTLLGDKLDKTGGNISGNLSITGDFSARTLDLKHTNLQLKLTDTTYENKFWMLNHQNGNLGFNFNEASDSNNEIVFTQDGNVIILGEISESGTNLSSKYLGITAKASNSDKLDGKQGSDYLLSSSKTISTSTPTGGVHGDIWIQV